MVGVQYMNRTFFGWQGGSPTSCRIVFTSCISFPASSIDLLPTKSGTIPRRESISSESRFEDEP